MSLYPKHEKNEREMPKLTLEKARELADKYKNLAAKFGIAQKIYQEALLQYPELGETTAPQTPIENGYEQYKQDTEKLADVAGSAANALDPENLVKVFGKNDAEVTSEVKAAPIVVSMAPASSENVPGTESNHGDMFASFMQREYGDDSLTDATATKPVASPATTGPAAPAITIAPPTPGTVKAAPATPASVPVVTPQPTQVPNQINQIAQVTNPDAAKLAQAKSIAEKIKHHPTTMTAADWEFERNKENRKMIDQALMDMSSPAAQKPEQEITMGEPDLNESRRAYAEIMDKYKKEKELDPMIGSILGNKDGVMLESEHERYLKLRDQYINKNAVEHNRIRDEQGMRAAMEYTKQEWKRFDEALLKDQPSAVRERVSKVMGKIGGAGLAAGILGFTAIEQGIKKIKETDWRKKFEDMKKKKPGGPMLWKNLIGVKSKEQTEAAEKEAKEAEDKKLKAGAEKLKQNFGAKEQADSTIVKQAKALDQKSKDEQVEREANVKKVFESIIGEPLEGETARRWNDVKSMELRRFMKPEEFKDWGRDRYDNIRIVNVSIYPSYLQKLHEKLLPVYKSYENAGFAGNVTLDNMQLERFINKAVADGELKV